MGGGLGGKKEGCAIKKGGAEHQKGQGPSKGTSKTRHLTQGERGQKDGDRMEKKVQGGGKNGRESDNIITFKRGGRRMKTGRGGGTAVKGAQSKSMGRRRRQVPSWEE